MTGRNDHRCKWFENLLAAAGEKGFSIVPMRDGEHRSWYLVARPFEPADLARITSKDSNALGVAVAMKTPLKYCPACGANLDDLIRRDERAFDALAEEIRSRLQPHGY
jgi:hypothetical protein